MFNAGARESTPGLGILYNQEQPSHNQATSSTRKTYFFAVLAIIGFFGLIVGIAGLAQIGSLTNQAIIMMGTGGGGVILFLIGVIGVMKNRHRANRPQIRPPETNMPNSYPVHPQVDVGLFAYSPPSFKSTEQMRTQFVERTQRGNIREMQRFGKAEWESYFGEVGEEPSLPEDIVEILHAPCPFSQTEGTQIKDTHMLVLIPARVNREPFTLNALQEFIQHPIEGSNGHERNPYRTEFSILTEHGNISPAQSYWVLMTRDIIPGSERKFYNCQKQLIQSRNRSYSWPRALEVAACISMEYVVSGIELFQNQSVRCLEMAERGQQRHYVDIRAGSLSLTYNDMDAAGIGISALRRF